MKYYRVFVEWGEDVKEGVAINISKKEANYLLESARKNHKIEKEKRSDGTIWYRVEGKEIMVEGEI